MNTISNIYLKSILIIFITSFISCKNDVDIFAEKEINLGSVSFNDTISVKINITNPYRQELILKNSSGSCGCTELIVKDSILKPNGNTIGTVEFTPSINGLKGNIEKAIVLETNSPQRFHEIIIKAKVE